VNYKLGCDAHKRYSQFAVLDEQGPVLRQVRVPHERGAIRAFVSHFPSGTPVALESVGNWYWIVDEIEAGGGVPLMAHAAKAKVMMGNVNKSGKLDAEGLGTLLHLGKLPTVWIAPGDMRDERELPRTRLALSKLRAALKNRIQATLAKYALALKTDSDLFSAKWRPVLLKAVAALPVETQRCVEQMGDQIAALEQRIQQYMQVTATMQWLKSLPGVGMILAIVIDREVGNIRRFASGEHFAGYAGTTPKVQGSAGKYRCGKLRQQCNHYRSGPSLKRPTWSAGTGSIPHVCRLYERIRWRKGHAVAVGAVVRHVSEAAYWILAKGEAYREPQSGKVSSRQGLARAQHVSLRYAS